MVEFDSDPPAAGSVRAERVGALVVGETATLLFAAKPAGTPVFPPHADPEGDCVLARLLAARPAQNQAFPAGFEGGIAHRLDTLTGGFVVVAKSVEALAAVRAEWGELSKFYRFYSSAKVDFRDQLVTAPIAHHPRKKDRVVVGVHRRHRGEWRPAWTRLRWLGKGWWEAEIRTGVLHQIRAHAAFAGVPLDGDEIYGGEAAEGGVARGEVGGTHVGESKVPRGATLIHVGIVGKNWSFWLPDPPGPRPLGPEAPAAR